MSIPREKVTFGRFLVAKVHIFALQPARILKVATLWTMVEGQMLLSSCFLGSNMQVAAAILKRMRSQWTRLGRGSPISESSAQVV